MVWKKLKGFGLEELKGSALGGEWDSWHNCSLVCGPVEGKEWLGGTRVDSAKYEVLLGKRANSQGTMDASYGSVEDKGTHGNIERHGTVRP